jgi:diadenylate cyclase
MIERLSTAIHLQDLGFWALIDILVLAIIIYEILLLIRGTRSVNILLAIAVLALCYLLTAPGLIQLSAVHSVLGNLLFYIPLVVIVLFQNQIRLALANLGRNPFRDLMHKRVEERMIEEVTLAAASLGSKRTGALIVIERGMGLRTFYETGIELDARISYDLLMNVFTRRSPLHDGAVIISDGRLKAASCYLPLTTDPNLSRTYGTRHRAAIGITEESDALAVVVSEERGVVSLAEDGTIEGPVDARGLKRLLTEALGPRGEGRKTEKPDSRVVAAAESGDA